MDQKRVDALTPEQRLCALNGALAFLQDDTDDGRNSPMLDDWAEALDCEPVDIEDVTANPEDERMVDVWFRGGILQINTEDKTLEWFETPIEPHVLTAYIADADGWEAKRDALRAFCKANGIDQERFMDAIKLGSCKRVIRTGVVKFGHNIKQMLMDKGYRVEAKPNHPGWWWWIRLADDGGISTWMGAQPDSDAYEITDSEEWAWAEALEHYVTLPDSVK